MSRQVQISLDSSDCIETSLDSSDCVETSLDSSDCVETSLDSSDCVETSSDSSDCVETSLDSSDCVERSSDKYKDQEQFEDTKDVIRRRKSEDVNLIRIENTMTKSKKATGQTMTHKPLYRKLKIEQHEHH